MGAHVVFLGPSTAGKTSLMLGLKHLPGEYDFKVDRTWTTRDRRPCEDDEENIFVNSKEFNDKRNEFLFSFMTFPTYEYGIEMPALPSDKKVRMRILMPVFAAKFRQLVNTPVVFCSIAPFNTDPANLFKTRDPQVDFKDMQARINRFQQDEKEAAAVADIRFNNREGLPEAISELGTTLITYMENQMLLTKEPKIS